MNALNPLWGAAAFALLLFWMAWREYARDNRRDAGLMLAIGVFTSVVLAVLVLL